MACTKKIIFAGISDINRIRYILSHEALLADLGRIRVYRDETPLHIRALSSLGISSASGIIELSGTVDLKCSYRVEIDGFGSAAAVPAEIFDCEYFANTFHYDGDDLGALVSGAFTRFKLWAPTASRVVLNLFHSGNGAQAYAHVDMQPGEKGIWSSVQPCGHGTYYTYTVTTPFGTRHAVDPYARSVGVNGERGMVVNPSLTDPDGWSLSSGPAISAYSEAVIWEVHVRDFSNRLTSSRFRGKYLAFTERGLVNEYGMNVGIDHLVRLGVTHVQLLPVFDYASVDECGAGAQFNWGYDPQNYNAPEGSYSTDPFHGEVRIKEFKQMVMALHDAGIGVIMDVVYNHTYHADSSFDRIVPYYYYRYTATGENSSASGCGNDTASERYMFGKFMADSAAWWMREYRLDGLRFDLMGLHDLACMQNIERVVHAINPHAIIYGEGWTMGATIDGSIQADQRNISLISPSGGAVGSIAVFNDILRDGLKGSVFDRSSRAYINGSPDPAALSAVVFGIKGGIESGHGWSVDRSMVINYMSCHDNATLWDRLLLSNGSDSEEKRLRMNMLGAAIIMTAKGSPFFLAGEEMLRSKRCDENSYASGDEINNIDWSVLRSGSIQYASFLYYKGLIEMRRHFDIFTSPETEICDASETANGILSVRYVCPDGKCALVLINPHDRPLSFRLEGEWLLLANADRAGAKIISRDSGCISIDGISARVYVDPACTAERS